MKPLILPFAGGLALLLTGQPAAAVADLVVGFNVVNPVKLQAGLSATYIAVVSNYGDVSAPVELYITFAGKLNQTGQIRAGGGMDCEVRHDAGINATIRCTGGRVEPSGTVEVLFQARGDSPGEGKIYAVVDPSHLVPVKNYENNHFQLNFTIK